MSDLERSIEALIFASESPISFKEIKVCTDLVFKKQYKKEDVVKALENLVLKYQGENYSFQIVEIADGYQFLSKDPYHEIIGEHIRQKTQKRITRAALETLSIIAYKQPVTKSEMEKIRGVSCDYSIQKLLEKELIHIAGRSDGPGKPLLYTTSAKFMNYFGLKSIKDLPKLKDFKVADNEIGSPEPIEPSLTTGLESLNGEEFKNEEE